MYFHYRDLRYVEYGLISPTPVDILDQDFLRAYEWLGQYCGFSPQIWLSRSRSQITGVRQKQFPVKAEKRSQGILFGFEHIQGFPVDYDFWCLLLNTLINAQDVDDANAAVRKLVKEFSSDSDFADHPMVKFWQGTPDMSQLLNRFLFNENDQVVVPQLNLKTAKLIVCRNELQKKTLRRMGFIEDRIEIRKTWRGR